jgi:competence protein ComEC
MAIHWAAVMLAWLAGIAVQLQQRELSRASLPWVLGMVCLPLLGWVWPRGREWVLAGLRRVPGVPAWFVQGKATARARMRLGLTCLLAGALGWAVAQWQALERLDQVWPAQALLALGDLATMDGGADAEATNNEGRPRKRRRGAPQGPAVWLTGQVAEMPGKQDWGWTVKVKVQSWQVGEKRWAAGDAWRMDGVPAERVTPRWVSVRLGPEMPEPMPGELWRWPVEVQAASGLSNPGGFDLDLWLWEQGVRAVGKVDAHGASPQLLRATTPWSPGMVERWRTQWRQRILAGVPDERVSGMVRGLTIGEQGAISRADWDTLRLTGTAHLAAISGLHITMMGAMCGGLLGWLWRRSVTLMQWCPAPAVARWGTLAGAVLYSLLAGWGVPAQRTVWMLAVVVILRSTGRRWPWPLTLLLAAVVVTALDPWALVSVGFWLSFVAVGVLMWGGADTLEVPGSGRIEQWRHAAVELWRTQRLATVGLAPLSLVFFQSVSVLGLSVNLVCIPWFTAVLTPLAMLGLVFQGFWRPLQTLMLWTLDSLHTVAMWPWGQWQVPAVSAWAAALAVLGGAWLLAPLNWRCRLWAVPLLLPLVWSTSLSQTLPPPAEGELDVMAADVGQGSAVLLRTARHSLLFDTGPVSRNGDDAGRRVLAGLLRAAGVHGLDVLLLSHGDADHTGGAATLLKTLPVQAMRSSLTAGDPLRRTPDAWGHVPEHSPCEAGQSWVWDGVRFDIIHPFEAVRTEGEARRDNEMSCVLRVRAHGRQVLITGDIETAQEAELVAREGPEGLASEVLLVPHHGSKTSSTLPFLQAVQPQVAVVQVGARNAYGHPHPKVMARYVEQGVPTVLTPRCGAWWWQSAQTPAQSSGQTLTLGGEKPGQCWRELGRRYWSAPEVVDEGAAQQVASQS